MGGRRTRWWSAEWTNPNRSIEDALRQFSLACDAVQYLEAFEGEDGSMVILVAFEMARTSKIFSQVNPQYVATPLLSAREYLFIREEARKQELTIFSMVDRMPTPPPTPPPDLPALPAPPVETPSQVEQAVAESVKKPATKKAKGEPKMYKEMDLIVELIQGGSSFVSILTRFPMTASTKLNWAERIWKSRETTEIAMDLRKGIPASLVYENHYEYASANHAAFNDIVRQVTVTSTERPERKPYVLLAVGESGSGKSTMVYNREYQRLDGVSGRAIDPHMQHHVCVLNAKVNWMAHFKPGQELLIIDEFGGGIHGSEISLTELVSLLDRWPFLVRENKGGHVSLKSIREIRISSMYLPDDWYKLDGNDTFNDRKNEFFALSRRFNEVCWFHDGKTEKLFNPQYQEGIEMFTEDGQRNKKAWEEFWTPRSREEIIGVNNNF